MPMYTISERVRPLPFIIPPHIVFLASVKKKTAT